MTRDRGSLVLAAALTGVTAVLLVAAMGLQATAGIVPLVVGVPTVLVLIDQLVREARRREAAMDGSPAGDPVPDDQSQRERITLAWMALLLALMWAFGVVAALPAFLLLYLRVRSRERWVVAVTVAAATWCVLFAGLGLVLGVQPPPGAVWTWLAR